MCFSHQLTLMVFHWSLRDSKSPQVSRILLSILADLNNAVVWMVSTPPLISKSSSPFINPFVTVPRAPIIIDINVTFIFHRFFPFPCKIEVFILLFIFFQFYSVISRDSKVHNLACSFFFVLVVWPRLSDPFVSENLSVIFIIIYLKPYNCVQTKEYY